MKKREKNRLQLILQCSFNLHSRMRHEDTSPRQTFAMLHVMIASTVRNCEPLTGSAIVWTCFCFSLYILQITALRDHICFLCLRWLCKHHVSIQALIGKRFYLSLAFSWQHILPSLSSKPWCPSKERVLLEVRPANFHGSSWLTLFACLIVLSDHCPRPLDSPVFLTQDGSTLYLKTGETNFSEG